MMYGIIRHMKRTTLFLDEGTDRELHLLAQREKLPVAALVRDALGRYLDEAKRGKGLQLRFLAAGRSAHPDTAERAEELLWADLQPHSSGGRPRARARRRSSTQASFALTA
jgi:hypothetical protein